MKVRSHAALSLFVVRKTHWIGGLIVAHVSLLKLDRLLLASFFLFHHSVGVSMSMTLFERRSGSYITVPYLSQTKLAIALRSLHQLLDRVIHNPDDSLRLARFIGRSR